MWDAILEGTCWIPGNPQGGDWSATVLIADNAGNQLWQNFEAVLHVISDEPGEEDTSPPEATECTVIGEGGDNVIVGKAVSQEVTVTVHATDDISGIDDPDADTRVNLYPPSGPGGVISCSLDIVSGDMWDAILEMSSVACTVTVTS